MGMDPDIARETALVNARRVVAGKPADVEALADAVLALDNWILMGGFLPAAWQASQIARATRDARAYVPAPIPPQPPMTDDMAGEYLAEMERAKRALRTESTTWTHREATP